MSMSELDLLRAARDGFNQAVHDWPETARVIPQAVLEDMAADAVKEAARLQAEAQFCTHCGRHELPIGVRNTVTDWLSDAWPFYVPRCGQPTTKGRPCRVTVRDEGDVCRIHADPPLRRRQHRPPQPKARP